MTYRLRLLVPNIIPITPRTIPFSICLPTAPMRGQDKLPTDRSDTPRRLSIVSEAAVPTKKKRSYEGAKRSITQDKIHRAIGQKPVTDLFRSVSGIAVRDNGTIAINDAYQTGAPKYFAATRATQRRWPHPRWCRRRGGPRETGC